MGDETTTVKQLKDMVAAFVAERDWQQFHTPKNLAMSIAIEAAELMELFQWSDETARLQEKLVNLREELADVVIYCLAMANSVGFDLSAAVHEKMGINRRKYPVEKYRGKYE